MSNRPNQFPLDLTGASPRNLIQNEKRTTDSNETRIFVPSGGVYFTESVAMFDDTTGRRLHPLIDYKCLHLHVDASYDSGKQCCCVIMMVNETITSVRFNYQVVGGHYSDNLSAYRDLIDGVDFNTLTRVAWGTQIYNKPETYPAAAHKHPGSEFGDWKRFHIALNNIYHALLHKDHAAWEAVYGYIDSIIANLNLTNFTDNYYNKIEIDNQLQSAYGVLATSESLRSAKEELQRLINGLESSMLSSSATMSEMREEIAALKARKQIGISTDRGNLLELRHNGFYYGIEAPADLSNLYVDAINGSDENNGTKDKPFRTLDKALRASPRDNTNTIWLKCIPENQHRDVCYSISHQHIIGKNVDRNIRCYGDTWVDGEKYAEMQRASSNHHSWYSSKHVNRPAIRIKWYNRTLGSIRYKACNPFYVLEGGRLLCYAVEFFVEQIADLSLRHPYSEVLSLVYGRGYCALHSCGFFRIVQDVDCVNEPVSFFKQEKWWSGYLLWNNRANHTVHNHYNAVIGYASGKDGDRDITGKPKYVNWCNPETLPAASNADTTPFTPTQWREYFLVNHDAPTTQITFSENHYIGNGFNTVDGAGVYPSNLAWMISNNKGISNPIYVNGVLTNIISNRQIYNHTKATESVSFIAKSIYLQAYKPCDIYQTTQYFRNSDEVRNHLGYGHWVRYAQGRTLVGVAVDSSEITRHTPNGVKYPSALGGEFSHLLKVKELPEHTHTFQNQWAGVRNPANHPEIIDVLGHGDIGWEKDRHPDTEAVQRVSYTGGNYPHSNMQPYVTVDMWKRIVSGDGHGFEMYRIPTIEITIPSGYTSGMRLPIDSISASPIYRLARAISKHTKASNWQLEGLEIVRFNTSAIYGHPLLVNGVIKLVFSNTMTDKANTHVPFIDATDSRRHTNMVNNQVWGWERYNTTDGKFYVNIGFTESIEVGDNTKTIVYAPRPPLMAHNLIIVRDAINNGVRVPIIPALLWAHVDKFDTQRTILGVKLAVITERDGSKRYDYHHTMRDESTRVTNFSYPAMSTARQKVGNVSYPTVVIDGVRFIYKSDTGRWYPRVRLESNNGWVPISEREDDRQAQLVMASLTKPGFKDGQENWLSNGERVVWRSLVDDTQKRWCYDYEDYFDMVALYHGVITNGGSGVSAGATTTYNETLDAGKKYVFNTDATVRMALYPK